MGQYAASEKLANQEVERLKERKQKLADAVVDNRISQTVYEEQLEAVEQKLLFANGALREAQIETFEIGTLLKVAEHALTDISRMWVDAVLSTRSRSKNGIPSRHKLLTRSAIWNSRNGMPFQ